VKDIADFLFQLVFLKKTPRTGVRFLGSGKESVAEHCFGSLMVGYVLAKLDTKADPFKLLSMCLFHDALEARTGDQNYVYKRYAELNEAKALEHFIGKIPFGDEVAETVHEYCKGNSREAKLAHDADQLDLLLSLKEQSDLGNPYAGAWIDNLLIRLQTDPGKKLAEAILDSDHTDWWFKGHDHWWIKGPDHSS